MSREGSTIKQKLSEGLLQILTAGLKNNKIKGNRALMYLKKVT